MGLLLLFSDPLAALGLPARVRLDTHLVSVTFPESYVVADRDNTRLSVADHMSELVADDPSTSIVAA